MVEAVEIKEDWRSLWAIYFTVSLCISPWLEEKKNHWLIIQSSSLRIQGWWSQLPLTNWPQAQEDSLSIHRLWAHLWTGDRKTRPVRIPPRIWKSFQGDNACESGNGYKCLRIVLCSFPHILQHQSQYFFVFKYCFCLNHMNANNAFLIASSVHPMAKKKKKVKRRTTANKSTTGIN